MSDCKLSPTNDLCGCDDCRLPKRSMPEERRVRPTDEEIAKEFEKTAYPYGRFVQIKEPWREWLPVVKRVRDLFPAPPKTVGDYIAECPNCNSLSSNSADYCEIHRVFLGRHSVLSEATKRLALRALHTEWARCTPGEAYELGQAIKEMEGLSCGLDRGERQ